MNPKYRIAIVHDYLNQMGGAERVVELLHRIFPEAPIFTTIVDRYRLLPELREADIRPSWMQKIPGVLKRSKQFFWLYPFAVGSFDLRDYDLVISSSSAYAKGAQVKGRTVHICYCHAPMRFAWDFSSYMEAVDVTTVQKWLARLMMLPLRMWDKTTSRRVHHLIANSSIVKERIANYYGRTSSVIFPPVNLSRFKISDLEIGDYFLVVSRLVSYKRIELAVSACTELGKTLVVIGDGPDRRRLESLAGPTIKFMGRLPDDEVVHYMQHCLALIFPGIEDFGITPLEVNACGRPVLAFHAGGALDTIKSDVNGIFFKEQTTESVIEGLKSIVLKNWISFNIRKHAEKFSEEVFMKELTRLIDHLMDQKERTHETGVAIRRIG